MVSQKNEFRRGRRDDLGDWGVGTTGGLSIDTSLSRVCGGVPRARAVAQLGNCIPAGGDFRPRLSTAAAGAVRVFSTNCTASYRVPRGSRSKSGRILAAPESGTMALICAIKSADKNQPASTGSPPSAERKAWSRTVSGSIARMAPHSSGLKPAESSRHVQ